MEGLFEALGLAEPDGEADFEPELEGEAEALGEAEPDGDAEAEGDRLNEATVNGEVAVTLAFGVSGFQIAVKDMLPPVTGAVAIFSLMSSETIFSVETDDSSKVASGELSCQISRASISVPVVVARRPPVVVVVPSSRVALAPVISVIQ